MVRATQNPGEYKPAPCGACGYLYRLQAQLVQVFRHWSGRDATADFITLHYCAKCHAALKLDGAVIPPDQEGFIPFEIAFGQKAARV